MAESFDQVTHAGKTEFLPFNVVDAAYARFERLYRQFDEVTIWFSGGKDSQLTMELARRTLDKMGMTDRKVHFIFMDMEFLEDEVIKTVESYFADERFEGIWIAAPQVEPMVVMGARRNVILWDKEREDEWGRLPPEHALMDIPAFEGKPFTRELERTAIYLACRERGVRGSLAIVNSQRFAENKIIRLPLMRGEPDSCWIANNPEGLKGVSIVRPIYDWSVRDVFRFFYDEGIAYSLAYDINMHNGDNLRAGTPPLDLVGVSKMEKLKTSYPTLYMQITTMWPEMGTEARYAADIDVMSIVERYPLGWGGILQYVQENFGDPEARSKATKAVQACRTRREGNRLRGRPGPTYLMPLLWVWQHIVTGNYRKGIDACFEPTQEMKDFDIRVFGGTGR